MKYTELVERAKNRLFIIAEAGVNHNGDLDTAFKLVDAAVASGCDAVKFQTWITEKVYSEKLSIKPKYQQSTTDELKSEYQVIKNLELSFDDFRKLKNYCDEQGIIFFSTPDERESADFLKSIGVSMMKTASQDVTNIPFLRYLSAQDLPIIFSSGACSIAEISEAIEAIADKNNELIILHCVSSYPAPVDEMNLKFIPVLSNLYGYPVGFSDHTEGLEIACAAVALGAIFFEKHLTLDRNMMGPDHKASLNPEQMKNYCLALRNAKKALGDGIKKIMPCERDARNAFQRFMVSAHPLKSGAILRENDIVYKKVVSGILPKNIDLLLGRVLLKDVEGDVPLDWGMFSSE